MLIFEIAYFLNNLEANTEHLQIMFNPYATQFHQPITITITITIKITITITIKNINI